MATYEVETNDGKVYEVDVPEPGAPNKSPFPTGQDFLRSGQQYLGNTVQAFMHPIQTAQGLGNVALGTAQKAIPGQQPQEPYADAVGEFILGRYGSVEKALETLKHDPVGAMADASLVLSGGAGLMARAGQVGKIQALATTGRTVGKVAKALDPLTVTSMAVGRAQQRTAGRLINSLIKPTNRQFSYGRNPGLAVAKEGIVATSLEDLATQVKARRQQVGSQIGQALVIPLVNNQRFDVSGALTPILDAITYARKNPRTNASLLQRLENLRDDLLGVVTRPDGTTVVTKNLVSVTPLEAFQFKTVIGELTKWTDNLAEDTVVNASLKKSYEHTRRQLERAVPGIRPLNERYGNLVEAEKAATRQAYAAERASRPGLMDTMAAMGGAAAGGAVSRHPAGAVAGALLSVGARHLANSPLFRTGLGAFLQKSSPAEIAALFRKVPGLQAELVRVGGLAGVGVQRAGVPELAQ